MKKFFLFFFSLFVGAGLFIWITKTIGWDEIKLVFFSFSLWHGAAILGLTISIMVFGIWKWKFILKHQGYNLSFAALAKPYFAGYSIIFLAPMLIFGGELFRSYSLKEKYSVPWQKALSSVIIDRISEITLSLITIFVGLIYFLLKVCLLPKNLSIFFGIVLVFFGGVTAFFYFKSFRRESIIKFFLKKFNSNNQNSLVETEKEIFIFFGLKKKAMWQIFGLAFLRVFTNLTRFWVLILFLGKDIGILSTIPILGFYYFATMLPIPAALGSHELVQSFAFNSMKLGANTGPALALIIRGAELIMVLIGALFLFRLTIQILEAKFLKKVKKLVKIKQKNV